MVNSPANARGTAEADIGNADIMVRESVSTRTSARDLGLGGYPYVGLAEARAAAFSNRQLARRGGNPTAALRPSRVPTFCTACERVDAAATWKGHGPEDRRRALERYCQIRRADVIAILRSSSRSASRISTLGIVTCSLPSGPPPHRAGPWETLAVPGRRTAAAFRDRAPRSVRPAVLSPTPS